MKRLLILLLLPLLIFGCSKDDETEGLNNMPPAQKDKFLIGQWSNVNDNDKNKGTLIIFKENKTFEQYEISDYSKKKRSKKEGIYKTGSYGFLDYGFMFGDYRTLLFIHSKTMIGFPSEASYTRDNSIYTLVE